MLSDNRIEWGKHFKDIAEERTVGAFIGDDADKKSHVMSFMATLALEWIEKNKSQHSQAFTTAQIAEQDNAGLSELARRLSRFA